ncbi:predicted protein, partial [Nematostella vectensis]
ESCLSTYSIPDEDTTPYNLPGWTPLDAQDSWVNLTTLCPKPWRYTSSAQLDNLPSWGYFTLYGGGGYVASLGYQSSSAIVALRELKHSSWMDRRTRAVFLELSLFNINTNILQVVVYIFES